MVTHRLRCRFRSAAAILTVAGLLLTVVGFGADRAPAAAASGVAASVFQCPDGQVLSDNGVTCEPAPAADQTCPDGQQLDEAGLSCVPIPEPDTICPPGERLDQAGLRCEPDVPDPTESLCPEGQKLDEAGLRCIVDESFEDDEPACEVGFSLAADGETCIADGPECGSGEVLDTDGTCVRTFQCSPGLILSSDLLTCISGGCPDDELLSVDGKRCVAPDSTCPDGSPRPVGGACLVVETAENADGTTEVIVRCDEADLFCQALVNQCAEDRAAGAGDEGDEGECADPRTSCRDGDEACEQANERLVECATVELTDDDGEPIERNRACDDLCPRLHRLDASGECVEYLDPTHPCVSFGQVPPGVTTNVELDRFSYLAGTGQCVTRDEFLRRLANFEAAAGAERDALELLRETTSSYLTIEEQLVELQLLLEERKADVRDFTAAAARADEDRARAEKELRDSEKELARQTRILEAEVLEAFVAGDNSAAVTNAVLASDSLTDISVIRTYSRALLADQVQALDRVTRLQAQAAVLADDLAAAQVRVEESLAAAVAAQQNLEGLLAETERVREEQLERRDLEAALVSELREDKADYAQELGIFDQASREIADILAEAEFTVTAFEDFDGLLGPPVLPMLVVSGFGPRLHPILGYVRNHNGLDFDANFGEPIYASAPGIVQVASSFGGYGNTVVLDHGQLHTLYAHMSVIGVEPGAEVEVGDIIGFIGSTGLSTGPHLHFEVWVGGNTAVDPVAYLDLG